MGNRQAELLREQHFDRMRKSGDRDNWEEQSDKRIREAERRQEEQLDKMRNLHFSVKNKAYKEFKELKELNRECSATQSGMKLGRDDAVTKETNYRRGGYGDRVRDRMKHIAMVLDPVDPTLRMRDKDRRP